MACQLFVIDDDDINDFILKRQIKVNNLPLDYKSSNSAESALEYLKKIPIDEYPSAIFLDIHMPLMNGFEFLEIYEKDLYSDHVDTELYMVSSSLRESEINKSKSYKCVKDFISKPVDVEVLKKLTRE